MGPSSSMTGREGGGRSLEGRGWVQTEKGQGKGSERWRVRDRGKGVRERAGDRGLSVLLGRSVRTGLGVAGR